MKHATRFLLVALAVAPMWAADASAWPLRAPAVPAVAPAIEFAQLFGQQPQRSDDGELIARMSRLENQLRQLTGMIEELQHRNNQLEQQLKRVQQDTEFRFQEMGPGRTPSRGKSGAVSPPPGPPPLASAPPSGPAPIATMPPDQSPPNVGGRRGDVFDPTTAPNAPGAPRVLGSMPGSAQGDGPQRSAPGTPLDLGSLAGTNAPPLPGTGAGFPSPQQNSAPPAATGGQQQAVLAPSGSARDEYDLAYGAVQRRDYELAVDGFRIFLANHSKSREPEAQRLVPEAHYWLGESQFQLKHYNDSAETFLKISTDFPNAVKAPDALLRLGQSLAALGERETACASLGHVLTKYPRASANVKRAVEQEQKRVRC